MLNKRCLLTLIVLMRLESRDLLYVVPRAGREDEWVVGGLVRRSRIQLIFFLNSQLWAITHEPSTRLRDRSGHTLFLLSRSPLTHADCCCR